MDEKCYYNQNKSAKTQDEKNTVYCLGSEGSCGGVNLILKWPRLITAIHSLSLRECMTVSNLEGPLWRVETGLE